MHTQGVVTKITQSGLLHVCRRFSAAVIWSSDVPGLLKTNLRTEQK